MVVMIVWMLEHGREIGLVIFLCLECLQYASRSSFELFEPELEVCVKARCPGKSQVLFDS